MKFKSLLSLAVLFPFLLVSHAQAKTDRVRTDMIGTSSTPTTITTGDSVLSTAANIQNLNRVTGVAVFVRADYAAASPNGNVIVDVMSSPDQDIGHLDSGAFLGTITISNPTITTANADATEANKLHDANGGFANTMTGLVVKNTTDGTDATIIAFVDSGELTLSADIFVSGETYKISAIQQETLNINTDARYLWLRVRNGDSGSVDVWAGIVYTLNFVQ